jgi:hypothetical protein
VIEVIKFFKKDELSYYGIGRNLFIKFIKFIKFSSFYNYNFDYLKFNDSFFNHNVENNVTLSFINFSVNGTKRNLSFIQYLLFYDFVNLCETWLLEHESDSLLLNLSRNHIVLHKSDMNYVPKKGRPYIG